MFPRIKHAIKQFPPAIIAYGIVQNWQEGRHALIGNIDAVAGATHLHLPLDASVAYVEGVFNDYMEYAGLTASDLVGKRVLEVGPGDNLGVAMEFLAAGASEVVCLDRFYSYRDAEQQRKIYQALRTAMSPAHRAVLDEVITADGDLLPGQTRITYVAGIPIERGDQEFGPRRFDLIVSRAVLEHVRDMDRALLAMDSVLAPNGLVIHKIDFRDHGMFTGGGHHPLTFLTVSDAIYDAMSSNGAKPNRRLISYYRDKFQALGYDARFLVTHIVGETHEVVPHSEVVTPGVDYSERETTALLEAIRPRLLPRFHRLSNLELLVDGIFLVAKKRVRAA